MKYLFALLISALVFGCSKNTGDKPASIPMKPDIKLIEEIYQTKDYPNETLDSPAFWHEGQINWLITSAKKGNFLLVSDAANGTEMKRIGSPHNPNYNFEYPNGVFTIDNYLFVVERNRHRVDVYLLPRFELVLSFGRNDLIAPYGIFIEKLKDSYQVFITDNFYENKFPDEMDKRIKVYSVKQSGETLSANLSGFIGNPNGDGKLSQVESLSGDYELNNLLIADEDSTQNNLKVYAYNGKFKRTIGKGFFKGDVEGITFYKSAKGAGFWIVTEQTKEISKFHIFDRFSFKYLGVFSGLRTKNTDGVWLTTESFGPFSKGAFFAVNNDISVSAFSLFDIAEKFGLIL